MSRALPGFVGVLVLLMVAGFTSGTGLHRGNVTLSLDKAQVTVSPSATPVATPAPLHGDIRIESQDGWQAWTHSTDYAAISQNWEQLVYVRTSAGDAPRVWRVSADVRQKYYMPIAWAPGTRLILAGVGANCNSCWSWGVPLATINAETGQVNGLDAAMLLTRQAYSFSPTQPGRVAIAKGGSRYLLDGMRLALLDLATGKRRDLTDPAMTTFEPAWSPDGKLIAYAAVRAVPKATGDGPTLDRLLNGRAIYIVNPDNGESHALTSPDAQAMDGWPHWTVDGTHLLYARRYADRTQVHRVSLDGKTDELLTTIAVSPMCYYAGCQWPSVMDTIPLTMDPSSGYPLTLHDTWVYQSTRYEGFNAGAVMTATSTLTETVVEVKTAPEYYAAKIRREISAETPVASPSDLQNQLARPAETSEYWLLVAGNRIYRQEGEPDLTKLNDQDRLELQFPLSPGDKWGWFPGRLPNAPDLIGTVYRQVLQTGTVKVPAGTFDGCFLIRDGWTTDTSNGWFCPGIGWVEHKSDHNGTPYGSHWVLVRYGSTKSGSVATASVNDRISNGLGTLAYITEGDLWVKVLPDGVPKRLTNGGGNNSPLWSLSGQWIALRRWDGRIWVMRDTGDAVTPLEDSSAGGMYTWSPVTDTLAFTTAKGNLSIAHAPDWRTQPVTTVQDEEGYVFPFTWSPDGEWLAYTQARLVNPSKEGQVPPRYAAIFRIRPDGSDRIELVNGGNPSKDGLVGAGWSRDGTEFYYWTDPDFSASLLADGSELRAVSTDGTRATRLLAPTTLLVPDFWSDSPDGKRLAVAEGSGRETWTHKRIAVVDRASGQLTYLTDSHTSAFSPAWSPDGKQIAYVAAPDLGSLGGGPPAKAAAAERRIWMMTQDGSDQHPLTSDPNYRDEFPQWSRDGQFILFARLNAGGNASIWLVPTANGVAKQVSSSLGPQPVTTWFGYYGYIGWTENFDWWKGP